MCDIQVEGQTCNLLGLLSQLQNFILPDNLGGVTREILEILVVMERHVSDGVILALLVAGVDDGVGGVGEVDQVTAILLRPDHLLLRPLLTVVDDHLVILSTRDQSQTIVTKLQRINSSFSLKTLCNLKRFQTLLV